ncbi:N-formylglutamate amidohydrolase [uncultured Lacinutrix sp.]|uniref:N-formylglutamate amidohydrolase n=1 Tax=uncultured Lacinutrix sp. TaxID=574032 RepID=UPI002611872C|nr:N-formylglutamate amidohydrolase [uncultured Lacinutrix sp.]
MKLVLTCEHGGNVIPENYSGNFTNKQVLETHRGFDLGALDLFQHLKPLASASSFSTTSRLLIELNRSLHHKNLFSEFTKNLSATEKAKIIDTHYLPYRSSVEKKIKNYRDQGETVLHLSIHSFTPQLNNTIRNCDIGLLYNATNKQEQAYCKQLKAELVKQDASFNVRFNYPYLGKADGFTTYLRQQFPEQYLGIEIEVNQEFALKDRMDLIIKEALYKAIQRLATTN